VIWIENIGSVTLFHSKSVADLQLVGHGCWPHWRVAKEHTWSQIVGRHAEL